ncbi:hypothetical protein WJX73_003217 [Symbiochloris irregularis]|uniref:DNA primase n=1 Tax=Symbiochloris irregularis TaxID=706552 RepID=A0AAW1NQA3_9CHLO
MAEAEDERAAKRQKEGEAEQADVDMPDAEAPAATADPPKQIPVQQLMRAYYGNIFPYQEMYEWLVYSNDSRHAQADSGFFQRREFCFTLDGDIFVRYQSFKDGAELHAALVRQVPAKIDIGPMYNVDPRRRNAYAGLENGFQPRQRELVFDIDLTDYDDVRTCGSGGHICSECWPFMAVAVQILDAALRDDFGFNHILWVFSGRRGIHAWVCDKRARELTDEQRGSIAAFLSVYKGQENGQAKILLSHHPSIDRAHGLLLPFWKEEILPRQKLLLDSAHWRSVLSFLPDQEIQHTLSSRWEAENARGIADEEACSRGRWQDVEDAVARVVNTKAVDKGLKFALQKGLKECVFAHVYPRLDVEVSKKRNHLLKAPLCVHPKTGKVCVPFAAVDAPTFDPDAVPTVSQLLDEFSAERSARQEHPGAAAMEKGEGWKHTSLASCMTVFVQSFLQPLCAAGREELGSKAREAAAQPSLAW